MEKSKAFLNTEKNQDFFDVFKDFGEFWIKTLVKNLDQNIILENMVKRDDQTRPVQHLCR